MTRLLVVGADAAGMSAAHQALRTARAGGRELEVVALDAGGHTSYSACGIPYWVAGDVGSDDDLVARTAAEHRAAGIDLRLRHRVDDLDLARGVATARDLDGGADVEIGFDEVLIATGAEPIRPDWAALQGSAEGPAQGSAQASAPDGVLMMKTLDDGAALLEHLRRRQPTTALVVGGGYVGVEAAETMARLGLRTRLVTRGDRLMSASLVPSMAALAREGLEAAGVEVVLGQEVATVGSGPRGVETAVVDGEEVSAQVVVVGIGVTPRTGLAEQAGVPLGGPDLRGALVPDERQQVADGVWAAGDCAAVRDVVTGTTVFVPLGTHANRAGRVAGTNLGGGDARFPGVVGTAITRVGALEVARTGLLPHEAAAADLVTREVQLGSTTTSGYMPGSEPMTVWALGEVGTGRLLGVQIVGGRGAGKRVDVAATAITVGLTAAQVAMLDLAYAPPFSPVWDPVQIACRKLADLL